MPHYEYDKDYPFAAFITNLGKYNEGIIPLPPSSPTWASTTRAPWWANG